MPLERQLAAIVGPDHVLTDPPLRASFETDHTRRFSGTARLVVRPADAGEAAAVLSACASDGTAVVPQGGNTGLVGGGVPRGGEAVISMTRLREIEGPDRSGQIVAGAGVTLAALQEACNAGGLDAGLDFGARDSATLGGIAACDAGGLRALRYGTARARIAGLEAVLPDGTVVRRMNGLTKDNAGYDLPALFVGSEGTLSLITAVLWQAVPALSRRTAALVPVGGADEAVAVLAALRAAAPSLESCDFLDNACLEVTLDHLGRSSPVASPSPFYVLAECAAIDDPTAELAGGLEAAGVADLALVADDTASRRALWDLREKVPESIAAHGVVHHLDVGVPGDRLGEFLRDVPRALATLSQIPSHFSFGHLGDGNVHVSLLGPAASDPAADDAVLALALECGGTISAEHGVGVAKSGWLERCRGVAEVEAMRAVKRALDPAGMMNPGVVLA